MTQLDVQRYQLREPFAVDKYVWDMNNIWGQVFLTK